MLSSPYYPDSMTGESQTGRKISQIMGGGGEKQMIVSFQILSGMYAQPEDGGIIVAPKHSLSTIPALLARLKLSEC